MMQTGTQVDSIAHRSEYPALSLAIKRALDISLALVAAVFSLPVIAFAALAIMLADPGTPFYIQSRCGLHGRPFKFTKLRTMRLNGDDWLNDFLAKSSAPEDTPETVKARDPRISRIPRDPRVLGEVGFFIRRYSIDELPQIWNVLIGDMSLVGPRALPGYHCDLLNPEFMATRSRVRPGITGLWQVEGRNNANASNLEIYDTRYLNSWSLRADLLLLCRTVKCVLSGSGI